MHALPDSQTCPSAVPPIPLAIPQARPLQGLHPRHSHAQPSSPDAQQRAQRGGQSQAAMATATAVAAGAAAAVAAGAAAGAAAAPAPPTQATAAGPAAGPQQAAAFDSSRYTLHSQGAEAVSPWHALGVLEGRAACRLLACSPAAALPGWALISRPLRSRVHPRLPWRSACGRAPSWAAPP